MKYALRRIVTVVTRCLALCSIVGVGRTCVASEQAEC